MSSMKPDELEHTSGHRIGMDSEEGYCLLSLDGGGVRGLSSLYLLKGLMKKINAERRNAGEDEAQLWQIFDLIGGTSTGGLIAIMLGRLHMNIDECIAAYRRLSARIFVKEGHRFSLRGRTKGRFSTDGLEQCLKEVIGEHIEGRSAEQELLNNTALGEDNPCKIFVCATRYEDLNKIARIRSYPSDRQAIEDHATIWEAGRATSAAPTFFNPITISGQKYGDGGLLANNPIFEVLQEARDLWFPKQDNISPHVKCIVSVGTGDPGLKSMADTVWGFAVETLANIVTETRKTAETFRQDYSEMFDQGRAFRFNVEQGLHDVGLEEHSKDSQILTATSSYMESQDHVDRVKRCARNLAKRNLRSTFPISHLLKHRQKSTVPSQGIFLVPYAQNSRFVRRDSLLTSLSQYLIDSKDRSQAWAALYGLSGAGKTQLAIEFVYNYRARFPMHSVLWIHGSTIERVHESFTAATHLCGIDMANVAQDGIIRTMAAWLQSDNSPPWLLVLDNADDAEFVLGPQLRFAINLVESSKGAMLVTTKNKVVAERMMRYRNTIEVPKLTDSEATNLLRSFVDHNTSFQAMKTLCSELQYHPLAIAQAAAYIKENALSLDQYLKMWYDSKSNAQDLLTSEFEASGRRILDPEIPNAVAGTMHLTLDHLAKRSDRAAAVLKVAAFLDPNKIPVKLILDPGENARSKSFVDAIGELNAFCFGVQNVADASFDMHKLVHLTIMRWLTSRLTKEALGEAAASVLARLDEALPEFPSKIKRHEMDVYLPHGLTYLEHDEKGHYPETMQTISLTRKVAEHLLYRGQFPKASQYYHRNLLLATRLCDPGSPVLLRAKYDSAVVANHFHQFFDAVNLCQEVVNEMEKRQVINRIYINTLVLLSIVSAAQKNWTQAHFAIGRAQNGGDLYLSGSPAERLSLNFQKAEILRQEADHDLPRRSKLLEEAETLLKETISQLRQLPGDCRTTTLVGLQHLTNTLDDLEHFEESEKIRLEIVESKRQMLGDDHTETHQVRRMLALYYMKRKQYGQAQSILESLLNQESTKIGARHPERIKACQALSILYDKILEPDLLKALDLQENVVKTQKTAKVLLADLQRLRSKGLSQSREDLQNAKLQKQVDDLDGKSKQLSASRKNVDSRLKSIIRLKRAVLLDMRTALGNTHPETLNHMSDTAHTLLQAYRVDENCFAVCIDEAIDLQREVTVRREGLLKSDHDDVLAAKALLGAILSGSARLKEARNLEDQVLVASRAKYGVNNVRTLLAMDSLADTLFALGDPSVVRLMEECYQASMQHLGDNNKETVRRHEFLQKCRIEKFGSGSSSSRKSISIMDSYMAAQGREITYQTPQFTRPRTLLSDRYLSKSFENDRWPWAQDQWLTEREEVASSISDSRRFMGLLQTNGDRDDDLLWPISEID